MNERQEKFLVETIALILEGQGVAESSWYLKQGFLWKYKELGEENDEKS